MQIKLHFSISFETYVSHLYYDKLMLSLWNLILKFYSSAQLNTYFTLYNLSGAKIVSDAALNSCQGCFESTPFPLWQDAETTGQEEGERRLWQVNTMQPNVLSFCFPQLILTLWRCELGGGAISNPRTVFEPPVISLITVIIMTMISVEQLPFTTTCSVNFFYISLFI